MYLIEGQLLHRILFSVKPQHESAIGITYIPSLLNLSHVPPHPTPLG